MTNGKSRAGAKRRSGTNSRTAVPTPCEWDWPPEPGYPPPGPAIDIDLPCETGAVCPIKRRFADALIEAMVVALRITAVLVILFTWLISILVRL